MRNNKHRLFGEFWNFHMNEVELEKISNDSGIGA